MCVYVSDSIDDFELDEKEAEIKWRKSLTVETVCGECVCGDTVTIIICIVVVIIMIVVDR